MNFPRLACVIPGYWPAMSNSAWTVGELARHVYKLQEQGVETMADDGDANSSVRWRMRVVTGCLSSDLSGSFVLDGHEVLRVGQHYSLPWRRSSFSRSAAKEMASWPVKPDVVILFDCPDQVAEFRSSLPPDSVLIVRFEMGIESLERIGNSETRRIVRSVELADQVWVSCRMQMKWLKTMGVAASKLNLVPNLVASDKDIQLPVSMPDRQTRRREARRSFGESPGLESIPSGDLLVIAALPMNQTRGMTLLLNAWRIVSRENLQARLWLVGDQVCTRDWIERVHRHEMLDSICFPGSFDSLDELLAAGDLFVHPLKTDDLSITLLMAMRAELCCLSIHSAESGDLWLEDRQNICLIDDFDPESFANRILDLLDDRSTREELAGRGREAVLAHREISLIEAAFTGKTAEVFDSGKQEAR